MSSYDDVLSNYEAINQSFEKLRYYLIQQLEKCFLTDLDDYNFTELINKVGEIEAVESYNIYNIKPTNKPEIDNTNYTTYNKTLYFRTRYYMKLLAYYLVLKGVPVDKVATKDTLYGLISLIDFIDVKLPITMTVQDITKQYDFGTDITLDYTLTDYYGNEVKNGEITIESDDIIYDSIEPGQPISFRPIRVSRKVNGQYEPIAFTITYHGSDKYQKYPPITREIIVVPAKIVMDIFMYNSTSNKYYNSYDTGYTSDMWDITVKTYNYQGEVLPNIPFSISLLNESSIDTSINDVLTLNSNSSINEVTDDEGNCLINCAINQSGNQIIKFETTYEDTSLMTNTEVGKEVNIYYYPLYMEQKQYNDYAGKSSYDYELIIRNINTGEQYDKSLDGQEISIRVNDVLTSGAHIINNGRVTFSLNNVSKGEYNIEWSINGDKLLSKTNIYSNFILPSKNHFFLTDTPDIYYAPLYSATYNTENWSPVIRKKATAWVYYYEENTDITTLIDNTSRDIYTDANGILHDFKEYPEYIVPRQYAVKLKTASDNLNEELIDFFEYTISKPFDIFFDEDESYIKEKAVFNIKIYDKEHYQMGQHTNYISFNKNFNGLYNFVESEIYDEDTMQTYYNIKLTIPQRTETIGKNTLTVTVNNYSESVTFKLLDKVFSVLTSNIDIGRQTIEIQCYDEDTTDINVFGEYIEMKSYEKEDNIFRVDAVFRKAGINTFTIDSEIITESFSITVNKGDISQSSSITIIKDSEEIEECYYSEIDKVRVKITINGLCNDIDLVYNFNEYYTETYTYDGTEHLFNIPDVKPNTYNIAFEYYGGDGNYIPFIKTKQLTILKDTPTIAIEEQYSAYDNT